MNWHGIFVIPAIAMSAFALLTSRAVSQQQSLKDGLIGSWAFVSANVERPSGSKISPFDVNAGGILIFADDGYFAVISTRPVAQVAFAYFGTFTVNEADKTLNRRYERSIVLKDQQRIDFKSFIDLVGDKLRLTDQNPGEGKTEFIYKRAK